MRFHGLLLLLFLLCGYCAAGDATAAAEKLFREVVWPVLETRCIKCHGPEKQEGELRLDTREAALKGGECGPSIVPGNPRKSLMVRLIHHADADRTMPPKEKLKPAEITAIEQWIKDGAPWPAPAAAKVIALKPGERLGNAWTDERNPIVQIFKGERLDLWSMKPLAVVETPPARKGHPIDVLVRGQIGKLRKEADRRTLARRLYFNLTGLPPSPEDLQAFLADNSSDAYERLVDKLLASPAYGEHWGRMWLDAVRYSDSNGFDWDEFRPLAWRFRDYVIRSFNADKPFDRFVREQLAGDELIPGEPRDAAEQDALLATSYLRMGPWDNSAASFGEQERVRQQLMNDLVETTGAAFLGLSMSCCRCHDHKTDPISHADFYRMRAFFEPIIFRDDLALDLPPEREAIRKHNAEVEVKLDAARKHRAATLAPAKERLRAERLANFNDSEKALLATAEASRDDAMRKKIEELNKKLDVSDDDARKVLTEAEQKTFADAEAAVAAIKKTLQPFTTALCVTDGDSIRATRVLFQGNLTEPREEVGPGFLSLLDPNPADIRKPVREKSSGRRSTLADWIVDPANPLTARVLVNRVWQGHFGLGIVSSSSDFGLAGTKPVHPELLDWLAAEFIRQGWSLKKLHRLIVTSKTYRQESHVSLPPLGPAPRRLSAEQLHDTLLAVSGRLTPSKGGPAVWPALPAEVLQANPAILDDNAERTKGWYPSAPELLTVRAIYMIQKRNVRVPFMEIFDMPDNATSCSRRNLSTVAPQALTLLNNPLAIECARAFAKRVEAEAGSAPEAQTVRAFTLAVQRAPDNTELAACLRLREKRSLLELCRALLNLNEFIYVD